MRVGVMKTMKIMRHLLKEWTLPDEMVVKWDVEKSQEVVYAERVFLQYLAEGWMAFSDEPTGRRQIFKFNPELKKIVLIPPLGGG